MFRTIGRLVAILAAAAGVGGGIYLFVLASGDSATDSRRAASVEQGRASRPETEQGAGTARAEDRTEALKPNGRGRLDESPEWGDGAERRDRRGRRGDAWRRRGDDAVQGLGRGEERGDREGREGHGGHGEFSAGRGLAGMLGTSIQLGVVALAVVGLQRWSRRTDAPKKETPANG